MITECTHSVDNPNNDVIIIITTVVTGENMENTRFTTVRCKKQVKEKLEIISKKNKRSMANLIEVWVDEAWIKEFPSSPLSNIPQPNTITE
jgi:hypothetical protein